VLFSNGPNKAFLVPDSCRATVRNGFSIHVDVTDDTIENNLNEACFSYLFVNLAVVLDFLILQDKHNICTLSLNKSIIFVLASPPLYIIYLHCRKINNLFVPALETGRKVSL
jgi:hypothetical protein